MENVLNCILTSLLLLCFYAFLANRSNNRQMKEVIMWYCWIVFRSILMRLLSSLQIAFYSVVQEIECMDMSDYDIFHLKYCFIYHGAPALAAFPSILLITVFFYLLFIQSPLCSSFSPVTAADRSLLMPFQIPLKPSTYMRTTASSALHLK